MVSTTKEGRSVAEDQRDKLTRLHVNLNRQTADALRDIAERKEISATEVIRQAVGTLKWIEEVHARGGFVEVTEPDGRKVTLAATPY
jgi:hypothetical protein